MLAQVIEKGISSEEKKAAAFEYEQKLLESTQNPPQLKISIWAEMLANGIIFRLR